MRKLILTALVLTSVHASASLTGITGYPENSIGANAIVPNQLVKQIMNPDTADLILQTPYTSFYRIDGAMHGNRLTFSQVSDKYSWPDDGLKPLAVGLVGLLETAYNATVTNETSVTAFVALYRDAVDPFARRHSTGHSNESVEGAMVDTALIMPSADGAANTMVLVILQPESGHRPEIGPAAYFFQLAI